MPHRAAAPTFMQATESKSATPLALQGFEFGPLPIRNRLVVAPMSRVSAGEDGMPTERMNRYYVSFARGGFGLVITEGTYPDRKASQAYRNQPGLTTSEQTEGWKRVVESVHRSGSRIIVQLMHAGALVQENPRVDRGIAPSEVRPKGEKMPAYGGSGPYPVPRRMGAEDFESVKEGFVQAARHAVEAGFDGVEIHGANGYLLDQFLTTYMNRRTDRYGGSARARIRFPAEVAEAVRSHVPDDFLVGYRLSQAKVNDFDYRWPGGAEEARIYFSALADSGVSYLHVAGEGADWEESAKLPTGVTLTELARDVTGLPVIANGSLDDPALIETVLGDGHADAVALGRAALANRDWPRRLARGDDFEEFDPSILEPDASIKRPGAR